MAQFTGKYSDEATKDIRGECGGTAAGSAAAASEKQWNHYSELDQAVRTNAKDVQKSFADIGKEES